MPLTFSMSSERRRRRSSRSRSTLYLSPLRVHGPWKVFLVFSRWFQYMMAEVGPLICSSPSSPGFVITPPCSSTSRSSVAGPACRWCRRGYRRAGSEEDMQHLGRADAVEELGARAFGEARDFGRQRFAPRMCTPGARARFSWGTAVKRAWRRRAWERHRRSWASSPQGNAGHPNRVWGAPPSKPWLRRPRAGRSSSCPGHRRRKAAGRERHVGTQECRAPASRKDRRWR